MLLNTTADNTFVWGYGGSGFPQVTVSATDAVIFYNTNLSGAGYAKLGVGNLNPLHPIDTASGAHLTAGGVWTDASSRDYKNDISLLTNDQAAMALAKLQPVTFRYKSEKNDQHVGFIAEDVPDLVATPDRKGLSPMDIVAVITKVVQEQQKTIAELQKMIEEQNKEIENLKKLRDNRR